LIWNYLRAIELRPHTIYNNFPTSRGQFMSNILCRCSGLHYARMLCLLMMLLVQLKIYQNRIDQVVQLAGTKRLSRQTLIYNREFWIRSRSVCLVLHDNTSASRCSPSSNYCAKIFISAYNLLCHIPPVYHVRTIHRRPQHLKVWWAPFLNGGVLCCVTQYSRLAPLLA